MKIDASDILVALCILAPSVLVGIGAIDPDVFKMALSGALGYAARAVVK